MWSAPVGVSQFALLNQRRFALEMEVAVDRIRGLEAEPPPVVFVDGSFVLSFVGRMSPQARPPYLESLFSLLEASHERRIPLVGYVDLSMAISPAHDSTFYAASVLRSSRARTVVLHLGASGATRMWVNGQLVREDAAVHPSRWDQAAFAVALRAGENGILLKVAHGALEERRYDAALASGSTR